MTTDEKLEVAIESLRFIEYWLRKNRETFAKDPDQDAAEIVAFEALVELGFEPIEILTTKPNSVK